jgi:hypothetical protein
VTLTSTASVRTNNNEAIGLFAQSIGGGGGTGGYSLSGGVKTGSTGLTIGIGGSGGEGMTGGTVTLTNSGTVITDGLAAHAILAQSIGGGGGDGGMALNATSKPPAPNSAATSTHRVAITVGGFGDSGGDGGAVNVIFSIVVPLFGD